MKSIPKDILIYYLYSFFIGFYLANGTAVLFQQEIGLSFSRIFVVTAIYMIMIALLEIPSGALADIWGRKRTVVLGSVVLAVASLAAGLSSNFLQIFLSFFVWAIGVSLISGAHEALLYDRLDDNKLYAKVFGKAQSLWILGTAVAGIVGPYLFSVNFRYAFLFGAIPFLFGGLIISRFHELKRSGGFSLRRQITQVKEGVRIAFSNRYILWAMGMVALTFAAYYTFSNAYQPYLKEIGFSIGAFSVILPIMFLSEAFGGASSGRIKEWLGERKVFVFTIILAALSLAVLGVVPVRPVLIFIFGYMFLQGVLRPVISAYSNRCLSSAHRATVISVQSMTGTSMAAIMLFAFGFLTDRIGLNNLLIVFGALVFILGTILLIVKPKGNEPSQADV